jgi:hypothetical protein
MKNHSRRAFLTQVGAALAAAETNVIATPGTPEPSADQIDFRFAPLAWQTTYCFPDDPYKTSLAVRENYSLAGHMEAVAASDVSTRIIGAEGECFLLADTPLICQPAQAGWQFEGKALPVQAGQKLRLLFRFPQERQTVERIHKRLTSPDDSLEESRQFWKQWDAFGSLCAGACPLRTRISPSLARAISHRRAK